MKFKKTVKPFLIASTLLIFLSCADSSPKRVKTESQVMEEMQKTNELLIKKEQIAIAKFVERKQWDATKTATGLYYWEYEVGTGDTIRPEQEVEMNLIISLLNGDTVYHYDRYGSEKFRVERANTETGLHEVVQYLKKGSKAQVVLPSYLAHGVAGDLNKIPPRSSVVYNIHILNVK